MESSNEDPETKPKKCRSRRNRVKKEVSSFMLWRLISTWEETISVLVGEMAKSQLLYANTLKFLAFCFVAFFVCFDVVLVLTFVVPRLI